MSPTWQDPWSSQNGIKMETRSWSPGRGACVCELNSCGINYKLSITLASHLVKVYICFQCLGKQPQSLGNASLSLRMSHLRLPEWSCQETFGTNCHHFSFPRPKKLPLKFEVAKTYNGLLWPQCGMQDVQNGEQSNWQNKANHLGCYMTKF